MESSQSLAEGSKRLLDTLAAGTTPPALTGMLNAARHNLTTKCLAVIDTGSTLPTATDPVQNVPPAPPVATSAVAVRRVTVQEFGRDILGLSGNDLSTSRLSTVGLKLARKWRSQPGKGEIVSTVSETGEKQWKHTFQENGALQTAIFTGNLDDSMLANNRIKFSAAYLGTTEVGNGQAYDVWTYQLDQAEGLLREAFN